MEKRWAIRVDRDSYTQRSAIAASTEQKETKAALAAKAATRPAPGKGMSTGTSLSPEDIRRIVADMVG
jgi:hypothetical protein